MAKTLLLCSVAFLLAAGTVLAQAPAGAPPLFGPEPAQAASAQVCMAQELDVLAGLQTQDVPICAGNPCDKTMDCRPAGLPECANCWCIGPAGDKWCGCF